MRTSVFTKFRKLSMKDDLWPFDAGTTVVLALMVAFYLGVTIGAVGEAWAAGGAR